MATATLSPVDTDKLSNLKSAVASLNQIRYLILHFSSQIFHFCAVVTLFLIVLLLHFVLDPDADDILIFFGSENEKSGFINLVGRYLRYSWSYYYSDLLIKNSD